jgi:hypothetical protein
MLKYNTQFYTEELRYPSGKLSLQFYFLEPKNTLRATSAPEGVLLENGSEHLRLRFSLRSRRLQFSWSEQLNSNDKQRARNVLE